MADQQAGERAKAREKAPVVAGCLYLVATPIGNLEDITWRAVRVLGEVDAIAAEDTRSAKRLLSYLGIHKPTISLFDANEQARAPTIVSRLRAGEAIALISEAGTPGISDPGYRIVRACIEADLAIDVIPGPSAVTTALLLSGFSPLRFRFLGFLPRKGAERRRLLRSIADTADTAVFYESARRLEGTLEQLEAYLGGRQLAIVREMTKRHQETRRGTAAQLRRDLAHSPARGEITLVVSAADIESGLSEQALRTTVTARLAAGDSPRQIAQELADLGHGRRSVYQLALELAAKDTAP